MSNELQHLPTQTQHRIRSTQIITSLPQLVSELVQNALDADARQVDIGVDCEDWSCWVRDDGKGMNKAELTALQDAGRYGTSKAYTLESLGEVSSFGFRGEALASIANLSCLEITSRTSRSRESWSIIQKGDKQLYNGPAIRWRRESQGTVVSVHEAFFNLPIRRLSHPSPSRTLELIRKDLECLALVFPHVAFSLENTHKSSAGHSDFGRIMKIPKTSSTVHAFRHLFGRALVEHVEEIHDTQEDIQIDGFISLNGAATKAYQYLYINRHLMNPCDLHRLLDSAFVASTFGRHALDEYNQLSQADVIRRSPSKSEKKPVYVLNITVSARRVDNCVEPQKNVVNLQDSSRVSDILLSVVQAFLHKHDFKSRDHPLPQPPLRKKRRVNFDKEDRSSHERHAPSVPVDTPVAMPELTGDDGDDGDNSVLWTDPHSGITYHLDRRTGNTYSMDTALAVGVEGGGCPSTSRRTLQRGFTTMTEGAGENAVPAWIQEALGANQTYVLQAPTIPSVSLSSAFVGEQERCQHNHGRRTFSSQAEALGSVQSQLTRFSREDLSKAVVLGQVDRKFLACVIPSSDSGDDQECASPLEAEAHGILVLIDQHAADERIRVERFMRELCKGFSSDHVGQPFPDIWDLEPPARVVLTRREADMLASADVRAAFQRWGIAFGAAPDVPEEEEPISRFFSFEKASRPREHSGYIQVDVLTLPEIVGAKLLADDHLRDLVKSYLASLETPGFAASLLGFSPPADSSTVWQRAMQWCPRELQELVNSKACRGAIMFNDALSLHRCERLVSELRETAVPFQCAHGRPSLVPLTAVQGPMLQGIEISRHVQPINWARVGKA